MIDGRDEPGYGAAGHYLGEEGEEYFAWQGGARSSPAG